MNSCPFDARSRSAWASVDSVRLIHLAGYGGPYPGSFIPMLRAVIGAAARRDWEC
jgi:hypothetical protein